VRVGGGVGQRGVGRGGGRRVERRCEPDHGGAGVVEPADEGCGLGVVERRARRKRDDDDFSARLRRRQPVAQVRGGAFEGGGPGRRGVERRPKERCGDGEDEEAAAANDHERDSVAFHGVNHDSFRVAALALSVCPVNRLNHAG